MLREPPFNYLVSFFLLGVILSTTVLGIISWLCENTTSLKLIPIEELESILKIIFIISGFIVFIFVVIWFYWGNKSIAAANPQKAEKLWYILFFLSIGLSFFLEILTIVYLFLIGETLSFFEFIILYFSLSLQTFIYFWLVTFLFSPINVKYIPLFKK